MPDLGVVEIVVLFAFIAWCVAVFVFLRRMSARGKKSAAETDPARRGMDELIHKVEASYPKSASQRSRDQGGPSGPQ